MHMRYELGFAEPKSVAVDSKVFGQGHQVWRGSSCSDAARCGAACRCCASNHGSKGMQSEFDFIFQLMQDKKAHFEP